jgi:hypothetical protein
MLDQATVVKQFKMEARRRATDTQQSWPARSGVAQAAERRVQASPHFALRSVSCDYDKGILVLRGRVASYYLKQLAQEAVRKLDGVVVIVNVIEVTDGENCSS